MRRAWRIPAAGWALVLAAALLSGCSRFGAYFNTFYHAKKYYAKAEALAANSTSDRLPPQAITFYEKSIEKCRKVIDKGGGWWAGLDDARYLMGAAYYGKRDYDKALQQMDELLLKFPESEHVPEALFISGLCHHRQKNYARADEHFERIARDYPGFERRDEILFLVGRGYQDDGEYGRAVRAFGKLVERFPKSKHREEALERIGRIHFDGARYDSSLAAYDRLRGATREEATYVEASLKAGECLVRLGRYDDALERYEALLASDPLKSQETPRIWIHMAEAHNLKGEPEEALSLLQRVVEHFGQATEAVEARFQIGYTYEVYLRDLEQARAAYEEAFGMKVRSVFRDEASGRLQNLKQIEELQTRVQSKEELDREARAEAALRVAELQYLGTGDVEGALESYREVAEKFADTSVGPRAAYAVAWIQYEESSTRDEALDLFPEVIRRYPASEQAAYLLRILEDEGLADESLEELVAEARDEKRRVELARRAAADSLARAREDSLTFARADSLAQAEGDSATVARADSLAQAEGDSATVARADSLAHDGGDASRRDQVSAAADTVALSDSLAHAGTREEGEDLVGPLPPSALADTLAQAGHAEPDTAVRPFPARLLEREPQPRDSLAQEERAPHPGSRTRPSREGEP